MRINSLPSLREIRSQLVLTADAPNRMAVSRASRDETLIRITRGSICLPAFSRDIRCGSSERSFEDLASVPWLSAEATVS